MDLNYIIPLGGILLLLLYEFLTRNIPTRRNLSFIDWLKRTMDRLFPNYHREDFPLRKHK